MGQVTVPVAALGFDVFHGLWLPPVVLLPQPSP
jgi:hypothetical protein